MMHWTIYFECRAIWEFVFRKLYRKKPANILFHKSLSKQFNWKKFTKWLSRAKKKQNNINQWFESIKKLKTNHHKTMQYCLS